MSFKISSDTYVSSIHATNAYIVNADIIENISVSEGGAYEIGGSTY